MEWRAFITAFGMVFLAELGDKTQLAAMTLAAQTRKPWAVFLGTALSLACVSAIGVAVGAALGEFLPLAWVKRIAGAAFVLVGGLMLLGKF